MEEAGRRELLTAGQVAKMIGVSVSTVHHYVSGKKIPFMKLERTLRFDPCDVEKWFAEKKCAPRPKKKPGGGIERNGVLFEEGERV